MILFSCYVYLFRAFSWLGHVLFAQGSAILAQNEILTELLAQLLPLLNIRGKNKKSGKNTNEKKGGTAETKAGLDTKRVESTRMAARLVRIRVIRAIRT